jgi:D-3-phosphoglycerate dehydrogenase / 2-oxoglutarate reductase
VNDTLDNLVLDLLGWMGNSPRPYSEVLEAWRTSCPRLPVWEEANDRGYIDRHCSSEIGQAVSVSELGLEHVRKHQLSSLPSG